MYPPLSRLIRNASILAAAVALSACANSPTKPGMAQYSYIPASTTSVPALPLDD